ncbi:MAG: hypothetical protein WAN36_16825 [Calditrichia bacterium]
MLISESARKMVMILCLIFTSTTWVHAQFGTAYPTLEELEAEHGYLVLTDEEIVEMELAELNQNIVEQDVDGFVEAFSEDYEEPSEGAESQAQNIENFMKKFFEVMNTRPIYMLPDSTPAITKGLSGTWDIQIDSIIVVGQGNKIKMNFTIDMMGLPLQSGNRESLRSECELYWHQKSNKWKIKSSKGLFPFFTNCMTKN